MKDPLERLRLQSLEWGIELDHSQMGLLRDYAQLLAEYQLANVIGTKDPQKILLEHIADSLSCFVTPDMHRQYSLIDVGTGAGLPGIPLAIARPDLPVLLLETTRKKIHFLEHACATLALPNLDVLHARSEDAARTPKYREAFRITTARALAVLPVVLEYCAPLLQDGGVALAMKSLLTEAELASGVLAAKQLGLALRETQPVKYSIQLPQKERWIAIFDKVQNTPLTFPRKVGLAKKRPLGV